MEMKSVNHIILHIARGYFVVINEKKYQTKNHAFIPGPHLRPVSYERKILV